MKIKSIDYESQRLKRRRGLCYKVSYNSRRLAWRSALHFYQKFGKFTTAYKCGGCTKFHLTTHYDHMPPPWYWIKLSEWMGVNLIDYEETNKVSGQSGEVRDLQDQSARAVAGEPLLPAVH